MNILFRADASITLGTGHIMRCLTLARELKDGGAHVSFVTREGQGNLCDYIQKNGFTVLRLPQSIVWNQAVDAQETINILKEFQEVHWLFVDHYSLDKNWEMQIKPYVRNIGIIDDLADRSHHCNLLLDQNFYLDLDNRYKQLVPAECKLFLGPQFALLREQFKKVALRERSGELQRVLVFYGGTDPTNETTKALLALSNCNNLQIDVIVGSGNPFKTDIQEICDIHSNMNFYCQVENIAKFMNNADLALGAVGTATWERCYLGLPSVVTVIADNQCKIAADLAKMQALVNLGWYAEVTVAVLYDTISTFQHKSSLLRHLSEQAVKLMGRQRYRQDNLLVEYILDH
jgi:UDP-2,4-diacetamido-2,4,6-trideoxy-beta-L-altropyranose hydrolase